MLDQIEGGATWKQAYDSVPAKRRHIAMHEGHLVGVNERDRPFITGDLLARNGIALDRGAWRERIAALGPTSSW